MFISVYCVPAIDARNNAAPGSTSSTRFQSSRYKSHSRMGGPVAQRPVSTLFVSRPSMLAITALTNTVETEKKYEIEENKKSQGTQKEKRKEE